MSSSQPRALGFWTCTALVIGNTLGLGIFVLPASLSPYGLNALSAWVITIVGCIFLATVFAGLARRFPQDDGPYAYTQRAFGTDIAFIVMWCYWVQAWVGNAALAIGAVGYLSELVPVLRTNPWLPPLTALFLIWLFILINLRGVRAAGWMQIVTTAFKLLPLFGVILLGLWQLSVHPAAYRQHVPPNPGSWHEVLAASTIALYAMLGFECGMIPASKVRDPARTIPRATLAGTVIIGLLFLCISAILILLIPQPQLSASNAPFSELFARYAGAQYGQVLAFFVVVSGLGALNGWTLIVGEVTQAFSTHGGFPASLGKLNSRAAPMNAFLLTGILASVMLLMNYNQSTAGTFAFLSVVVTAATLPLYLVCSLAVWVLWKRGQHGRPGGRQILWFAVALFASAYCIWAFVGTGTKPLLWALALCAVGIPFRLCSTRLRKQSANPVPEATQQNPP